MKQSFISKIKSFFFPNTVQLQVESKKGIDQLPDTARITKELLSQWYGESGHDEMFSFFKRNGLIGYPLNMLNLITNPTWPITTLIGFLNVSDIDPTGNLLHYIDLSNTEHWAGYDDHGNKSYLKSMRSSEAPKFSEDRMDYINNVLQRSTYISVEGRTSVTEYDSQGNTTLFFVKGIVDSWIRKAFDANGNRTLFESSSFRKVTATSNWPGGQLRQYGDMMIPLSVAQPTTREAEPN